MAQHYLRTQQQWAEALRLAGTDALYPWMPQRLREEKAALLWESYAPGTRQSYAAGWNSWIRFRAAQAPDPFLWGGKRAQEREDEDALLGPWEGVGGGVARGLLG